MQKILYTLLFTCFALIATTNAQNNYALRLKSRTISVAENKNLAKADFEKLQTEQFSVFKNKFKNAATTPYIYVVLQFYTIPSEADKAMLGANGITPLSYLGGNAYWCSVESAQLTRKPSEIGIRSLIALDATDKMAASLALNEPPAHAIKKSGTVDVVVVLHKNAFAKSSTESEILAFFENNKLEIIANTSALGANMRTVRIAQSDMPMLATMPIVAYIEPISPRAAVVNQRSRTALNVAFVSRPSGLNLTGNGITVGIGDDGDVVHLDFNTRIERKSGQVFGGHGTHVTGTMTGSGLINPRNKGMASGISTVLSDYFDAVLTNTPTYITNFNMSLTNNSWDASAHFCPTMAEYTVTSNFVDNQLFANDKVLHVFAAGNSAALGCISGDFGTIPEGFQSSKNILTVGNTEDDATINIGSSKGPVRDGRLKPEIVAIGANIASTGNADDAYFNAWGTSMACPAITGGLALLSERYKTLNGVVPDGALLKAIAMNTAHDLGNIGPDYTFGFGWLDARRGEQTITNNTIFTNTVAHAATQTHSITVPSGAAALRVLLYWHDPEAAASASPALVNNLDLTVTTPSASVVLPWILNPMSPASAATQGIDNLNNQEQVTINTPAAGTYTFTVAGTSVPMAGPQKYYVVYEIVQSAITVLYPAGDEKLKPAETEIIRWEATDNSANTFTLAFTTNNGGAWTNISTTIPAANRQFSWTVPSAFSAQCRIRVTRNVTLTQDESDANFTILGQPALAITNPCSGYANLTWAAITGAVDYEIFRVDGATNTVTSVATTALLTYLIGGLDPGRKYYFAVVARTATAASRRSVAIAITPNAGACSLAAFNGNLELTSVNVNNGRLFTSTALGATQTVAITVTNRDNAAYSGNVTATYQVNGGATVSQTFTGVSLAIAASTTLTFTVTTDLSSVNTYTIAATISPVGDTEMSNNNKTIIVRQVDNPVLTLPVTETFEGATNTVYTTNTFATPGIDRLDYNSPTANSRGRLRMNVLPNLAHGGSKAMTFDALFAQAPTSANEGILTFNLSAVAAANLRSDFYFQHHNDETHPGDMVWIRGNDGAAWLPAYDLYANQGAADVYNSVAALNIKAILTAGGQTASSSFQMKFGQEGNIGQSPNASGDGYTFDDIKIYDLQTDLSIKSVDMPVSCNVSAGSTVAITVENTGLTNIIGASIPISYTITPPTGAPTTATETATVTVNTGLTQSFTFATPYTFSQIGDYTIAISMTTADDVLPNNMISEKRALNQGIITAFPYVEGFEGGAGNWYHNGKNDDWTLGTPAKTIITKAANGANAWVTKTTGAYSNAQLSYLYTPCFDLTTLTNPILSFSFIHDLEYCPNPQPCDWIVLQYSTDGKTWTKLGAQGDAGSTKWHNDAVQGWTNVDNKWHVASLPIPAVAKTAATRFRFVLNSDTYVNQDGAAIDDFSIFEKQSIYAAANTTVTQMISGSNWITFASGGNVLAQINPQGNNLGSTDVKSFIFAGALRNNTVEYYMDRNLVINPTNAPSSPVKIRIFFLKTEIDETVAGTGCGSCSAPNDAYVLGITKFSGSAAYENGDLSDNFMHGTTTFILPANTHIQPYDNGYYAEFEVGSFSEFWLNHGGASGTTPLPIKLLSFDAAQKNKDAYLKWLTATETNCSHYDIELADAQQVQYNIFKKIGSVKANGTTSEQHDYHFVDTTLDKNGSRYYRLRIVDFDGSETFSPVRSLRFYNQKSDWALYPNPTTGTFKVVFDADAQAKVTLTLTNTLGQQIATRQAIATGNAQTVVFDDFATQNAPAGVYLVTIDAANGRIETLRLVVSGE